MRTDVLGAVRVILVAAALGFTAGCSNEPAVTIAAEGSLEDLQATIEVLNRQLSQLEAENARLRVKCRGNAVDSLPAPGPVKEPLAAEAASVDQGPAPAPPTTRQPDRPRIELVGIKGRATERNDSWWRWAWVMEVHNSSSETVTFDATIKWVDKDGFPIEQGKEYNLQIGPGSSKTFNGNDLVRTPGAALVGAVKAELHED